MLSRDEISLVAGAVVSALKPRLDSLNRRIETVEASGFMPDDDEQKEGAEKARAMEQEAAALESQAADKRISAARLRSKGVDAMSADEKGQVKTLEAETVDLEAQANGKRLHAARVRKAIATGIPLRYLEAMSELITDSVAPLTRLVTDNAVSPSSGALATDSEAGPNGGKKNINAEGDDTYTPAPQRRSLSASTLELLSKFDPPVDGSKPIRESVLDAAMAKARVPVQKQVEIKMELEGAGAL